MPHLLQEVLSNTQPCVTVRVLDWTRVPWPSTNLEGALWEE